MGIQDREYYQYQGTGQIVSRPRSAVGTLILLTIGAWILQLLFKGADGVHGGPVTRFLGCTPDDIFVGFPHLWKLVTANFAHHWSNPWHLVGNMLFLWFFGRELESLLGRRELCLLYIVAGALAVLGEVVAQHVLDHHHTLILGGSGAVMAIVVLFTCLYPTRKILVFFFLPAPVWVLCAVFIFQDIGRAMGDSGGVASFAHLCGAAWGFLYWRYDLRWSTLARLLGRLSRSVRGHGEAERPRERIAAPPAADPRDEVSRRIDVLLDKIHVDGMSSLSAEERQFLEENASRYRRT